MGWSESRARYLYIVDECRDVKQSWPSIVADALIVRYVFPAVLKMNYPGVYYREILFGNSDDD